MPRPEFKKGEKLYVCRESLVGRQVSCLRVLSEDNAVHVELGKSLNPKSKEMTTLRTMLAHYWTTPIEAINDYLIQQAENKRAELSHLEEKMRSVQRELDRLMQLDPATIKVEELADNWEPEDIPY